jgi:hypothetical protein
LPTRCIEFILTKKGFRCQQIAGAKAASCYAYMKLHLNGKVRRGGQNIEYRTAEFRRVVSRCSVFFYKQDRIPPFDIRYALFDIRYSLFKVSFFDQTERSRLTALLTPET